MAKKIEYTKEDILKDAPDFVLIASPYMQDKYVAYEMVRRELDEHPDRFMQYEGNEGYTYVIDLKLVNIKGIMAKRGASQEAINDATEIRTNVMLPLLAKFHRVKSEYFHAFDLHNDKAKALAKLTPMLLDLFGSMHNPKDIIKIIRKKEGYSLGEEDLVKFFNNHKSLIEARQSKYVMRSDRYKVATEAGRLEIINDCMTDLQLKYEEFWSKGNVGSALNILKEIRALLEAARKEVKGNEIKLTIDGKIDINATLHGEENISRVMRDIPVNSLIVGMVAAKSGIRPEILMHQLCTSYYKDFNGFASNPVLGSEKVMLPGALIKTYDWGEIKEGNKKFVEEMAPEIVEAEIIEEPPKSKTRERLLNRLRQMKGVEIGKK